VVNTGMTDALDVKMAIKASPLVNDLTGDPVKLDEQSFSLYSGQVLVWRDIPQPE
jgi:hypothetical protein